MSNGFVTAVYCKRTKVPKIITKTLMMGDDVSHAGILIGNMVVEAKMIKGVVLTPFPEWERKYAEIYVRQIAVPFQKDAENFALAQVGKPYDYKEAFFAYFNHNPWDDPSRWYCSELVEATIKAGGRNRFHDDIKVIRPQFSYMVR